MEPFLIIDLLLPHHHIIYQPCCQLTSPPLYPKKSVIFQGTRISYGNLTPCVPLSLLRRGGGIKKRGLRPLLDALKVREFKRVKERLCLWSVSWGGWYYPPPRQLHCRLAVAGLQPRRPLLLRRRSCLSGDGGDYGAGEGVERIYIKGGIIYIR